MTNGMKSAEIEIVKHVKKENKERLKRIMKNIEDCTNGEKGKREQQKKCV